MLSIFKVLPIMNTYRLKNQICLNSLLLNLLIWIEKSYFLQYLSDRQSACVLLSDHLGTRGPLLLQCQKRFKDTFPINWKRLNCSMWKLILVDEIFTCHMQFTCRFLLLCLVKNWNILTRLTEWKKIWFEIWHFLRPLSLS